jgi:hypothetical protein
MKKWNLFLVIGVFLLSFTSGFAHANAQVIAAPGGVFYKLNGAIVERDATLLLPARGQGDITLQYTDGALVTDTFSYRQENGRTVFYVVFKNIAEAPGMEMAFMGTYIRGSNLAVYYGDIYTRAAGFTDPHEGWNHAGGFKFSTQIP